MTCCTYKYKRMYSESESSFDSDSDEEYKWKKCLPVDLPEDFDPTNPPTTGEEYLHHVMYEAKNCQQTVSVDIDQRKYNHNQTQWVFNTGVDFVSAPKSMAPSQEWQLGIVNEFNEYREYVFSVLPKMHNPAIFDSSDWIEGMNSTYPKLSILSNFNCEDHSMILYEINDKLELVKPGSSVDDLLGCWIYNILGVLEKPLNSEQSVLLRQLSKLCSIIRSKLSDDALPNCFIPLNVFICIIGRCFGQLDLTDS